MKHKITPRRIMTRSVAMLLVLCLLVTFVPFAPASEPVQVNAGVDIEALLTDGSHIYMGSYRHASALSEGAYGTPVKEALATPILWQVLGDEKGNSNISLLSKYVLDSVPFNPASTQGHNVFATSSLRSWLNDTFIDESFLNGESSLIASNNVTTRMNDTTANERIGQQQGTLYPVQSTDKVYLPSGNIRNETVSWTTDTSNNLVTPNRAQLKSQAGTENFVQYWLRSPFYGGNATLFVPERAETLGAASPGFAKGIRPVTMLDPANIVFASEILNNVTGRPGATQANAYYVQPTTGSAYKLTVLGGSGDANPYRLYALNYDGAAVPSFIQAVPGESISLTAIGNVSEGTTINYKLVDRRNNLVGYGVGAASVAEAGNTAITLNIPTNLSDAYYTAYIWLQKNNELSSHEASLPVTAVIRIGEGEVVPRAMIINPAGEMLTPGQTLQLSPQFVPANTTDQSILGWTSSNPSVATVSNTGLVTAVGMGTTIISAISRSNELIIGTSEIIVTDGTPGDMVRHIVENFDRNPADADLPWTFQPGNETGNTGATLGHSLVTNAPGNNNNRSSRFQGGGTGNRGNRMNLREPIQTDYRVNYSFDWYPQQTFTAANHAVLGFQDQTGWANSNYIQFIVNSTGVHYRLGAMTVNSNATNLNLISSTSNTWYRFNVDINFMNRTISLIVTNRATGAVVLERLNMPFASGTSTSNRISGMILFGWRGTGTLDYQTHFDNWDIRVYTAMSRPTLSPITNENPRTGTFDVTVEPYTVTGARFNLYITDLDGNETFARTVDAPGTYTLEMPRGNAIYAVTAEAVVNGVSTNRSFPRMAVLFEAGLEPPEPVTQIAVTPGNGLYTLEWTPVQGADTYLIYRAYLEAGPYELAGEVKNVNTFTDTNPYNGIVTFYKVVASGEGGLSVISTAFFNPVIDPPPDIFRTPGRDRAVTAIDLSGRKGGDILVTAADSEGNEYTSGVYLSWRWYEADTALNTTFDVFRNGVRIATGLTITNLVDEGGKKGDVYKVVGSSDTALNLIARDITPWEDFYLGLQLYRPANQRMPDGQIATYATNDMTVADLTGDGVLDLIVKWYPSNARDSSPIGYSGTTIFDAYSVDWNTGAVKLLWRIDLGVNVRSGAHYAQFVAGDFRGIGRADFMVQTADGSSTYRSLDGTDRTLVETGFIGAVPRSHHDTAVLGGRANHDFRDLNNSAYSSGRTGHILDGPEYVTAFDGATGQIIDTIEQIHTRGTTTYLNYGDANGNRSGRFNGALAYLDGLDANPYYVLQRGYYQRTTLAAYGINEAGKLYVPYRFDTRATSTAQETYEGRGNHGIAVADITGDGKDNIIIGPTIFNSNLTVLNQVNAYHGDAMHISNFISDEMNEMLAARLGVSVESLKLPNGLPRQYIMMVVESSASNRYNVHVRDALTGTLLVGYWTGIDTGRGMAADIDPTYKGAEFWASAMPGGWGEGAWDARTAVFSTEVFGLWLSNTNQTGNLTQISQRGQSPSMNFSLFWDGDLLSNMQDHHFIESSQTPINTNITKWDHINHQEMLLFQSTEVLTTNGTKGNPGLSADILGDWREELIFRERADHSKIRVYMTTIQTDYVIPHLMEDHQYAMAIQWQQSSYNQPPNTSYMQSDRVITARNLTHSVVSARLMISYEPANDGTYGFEITGHQLWRKDGAAGNLTPMPSGTLSDTTKRALIAAGYSLVGEVTGNDPIFDFDAASETIYSYVVIGVTADGKLSYLGKPITFTTPAGINIKIDRSELVSIIRDIEALELSAQDYTTTSWSVFYDAHVSAVTLLAKPDAELTQEDLDDAAEALMAALEALVDVKALKAAIAAAEALDIVASNYTAGSWAAFTGSLDAAKALLIDGTAESISAAIVVIDTAVSALVDITALRLAILNAEEAGYIGGDYTGASWAAFEAAIVAAKALLADANATAAQITDIIASLTTTETGLISVVELREEIIRVLALELVGFDYSAGSWAIFDAALTAAKNTFADPNATTEQLAAAVASLQAVIDSLVYIADLRDYHAEVEEAGYSAGDFTAESWETFAAAFAALQAALADPDVTQEEVDAALAALKEAIEAFEDTVLLSATPEAFVVKLSGNTNELYIVVTEVYCNGKVITYIEAFTIRNNAANTYMVEKYQVFVDTKGNDQIREIYIV